MTEILPGLLLLLGAGFMLLGAVGLNRLPDLYLRMHAATKSPTLGMAFTALAVALHFATPGAWISAGLLVAFFFLTAPVAAHVIGRAAYLVGVPLWRETRCDELARSRCEPRTAETSGPGHQNPEPRT